MENSKNSRKYTSAWYGSLDTTDTRYYGVFIKTRSGRVFIDPKRWEKHFGLPDDVKKVMARRNGPLFQPLKMRILDYQVNNMLDDLSHIWQKWNRSKRIIASVLSGISGKTFTPMDDDLAMCGIVDPAEAADRANMRTSFSFSFAESEKKEVYVTLYAQFFHQMASQVEALFLKTLSKNGYEGDKFNRNVLYAFKGKNAESVKMLDGFVEFDKMYAIWNFIKHNSLSTFDTLKKSFPELIKDGEYSQGELACYHVNINDTLIESILTGIGKFICEYCRMAFKENSNEASWNSDEFFLNIVNSKIRVEQDPLGIDSWFGE